MSLFIIVPPPPPARHHLTTIIPLSHFTAHGHMFHCHQDWNGSRPVFSVNAAWYSHHSQPLLHQLPSQHRTLLLRTTSAQTPNQSSPITHDHAFNGLHWERRAAVRRESLQSGWLVLLLLLLLLHLLSSLPPAVVRGGRLLRGGWAVAADTRSPSPAEHGPFRRWTNVFQRANEPRSWWTLCGRRSWHLMNPFCNYIWDTLRNSLTQYCVMARTVI